MTQPNQPDSVEKYLKEFRSAFKDPKGDFWLNDYNSEPSHVEDWLRHTITQAKAEERERILTQVKIARGTIRNETSFRDSEVILQALQDNK